MELSIEITETQFEILQERAKRLGIPPKQLAKSALTDLLNANDDDFRSSAEYVLNKNKELYKRLS